MQPCAERLGAQATQAATFGPRTYQWRTPHGCAVGVMPLFSMHSGTSSRLGVARYAPPTLPAAGEFFGRIPPPTQQGSPRRGQSQLQGSAHRIPWSHPLAARLFAVRAAGLG
jgi:hypothetical protein